MSTQLDLDDVAHGNPLAEQELRELIERLADMRGLLIEWRAIDPEEVHDGCTCCYCRRAKALKEEK